MGEPSGRPQRLRGLAPGPSLLAANLNCPGFLISKAGINRHPPPPSACPPRAVVKTEVLLCVTVLAVLQQVFIHTESQLYLGRWTARARTAENAVLTLRLSHKPSTCVKHFTRLSPAPQEEAARAHPAGSALHD